MDLKKFLKSKYSSKDFINFIGERFYGFEPSIAEHTDEDLSESEKKEIKSYKYLGSVELDDGKEVGFFEFLSKIPNIENKRVGFNKILKKLAEEHMFDGALASFYHPESPAWRLSFVGFEYDEGKAKVTNLKRYTYVLGKNIPVKTAYMQLKKLSSNSIDSIKECFSLEPITKEFYERIQNWYAWAINEAFFPGGKIEENLIRFLTRIIFIWFLKEKKLINEKLFDKEFLKNIVKDFGEKDNYYNVILQNLFFATLNRKIEDRCFVNEGNFLENKKHFGIKTLYRYQSKILINKDKFLQLFEITPFINGGLFECLDDDKNYIDGFSRNEKKRAKLPDYLFFGEKEVDLSFFYGTKKKIEVNGIIDILKEYHFTINENILDDKDVSLDPELLGHVFENLLASFNPDTQKTARKVTGSYYTPKEVVDYMVENTLTSYLFNNGISKEILDKLFSYEEIDLTLNQKEKIIDLLDNLKVLDPACGSGAFPIGMLQKIVFILHKIDPNNKLWKRKLFDATPIVLHNELEKTLKNSNIDYARKLHIIQNTIFGVDIQPIAIQIAKLRFFISLIIEQNPTNNKNENYGITPLPNLETKFVCANTLLPIDKKAINNLFANEIEQKEKEILKNREQYFYVKTRTQKLQIIKKDETLRKELLDLLISYDMVDSKTAKLLANWNPYNANAKADFFDSEFMFGIKVFDIIIGNPPYVRADSGEEHLKLREKILNTKKYKTLWEKWDLYVAFIEIGFNLLKEKGVISYIIPSAYLTAKYAKKSREFFVKNSKIERIDFAMDIDIFDASVKNIIFQFCKCYYKNHKPLRIKHIKNPKNPKEFGNIKILETDLQENLKEQVFNEKIKKELKFDNTLKWGEVFYVSVGLVLQADEKKAKGLFKKNDLISDIQDKIHPKPYIEGKDIEAYKIKRIRYLEWGTERCPALIRRKTFPELYQNERIIRGRMTDGAIDDTGIVSNDSTFISTFWHNLEGVENKSIKLSVKKDFKIPKDVEYFNFRQKLEENSKKFNIKYCLAILNSKFAKWCFNQVRRNALGLYPDDIKQLPIKIVDKEKQKPFEILVDYIIFLKQQNLKDMGIKYELMPIYFEQIINGMVFELYFEDLLKKHNRDVIQYIDNLVDISDTPDENKLEVIKKVFDELNHLKHPVRNNLFYMDSIPEIRIIKESK